MAGTHTHARRRVCLHVCVTLTATLAGQRGSVQHNWQLKQVGRRSGPALINSSDEEPAVGFHFLEVSSPLFICGAAPSPNWGDQSVSIPLAFFLFPTFFFPVSFNLCTSSRLLW